MMGRCRAYERQIALLVGGDLDERLAPALRLHVRECASCARVLQAAEESQAALAVAAVADVCPEMGTLLPGGVRAWCRPAPRTTNWRGWLPSLGLAAACGLIGVGAAVLPGPDGAPARVSANSEIPAWIRPDVSPRPVSARRLLLREAHPAPPRKRERF